MGSYVFHIPYAPGTVHHRIIVEIGTVAMLIEKTNDPQKTSKLSIS
jgi:hypothetical protein